jgi:hypothetical protein
MLGLAYASGLHTLLTLDALKSHQARLAETIAARPLVSIIAYFGLYVIFAAFSLPGAVILTLGAGALFGLAQGTLIVSFASTIGATLAFLSARFLLREKIAARYGGRLAAIDAGIRRLEVTSFVHPKRVPQMADAEEVIRGLPKRDDVTYIGLVLNRKGFERAQATGIHEIGMAVVRPAEFIILRFSHKMAEG